jgi:hypothetical protein
MVLHSPHLMNFSSLFPIKEKFNFLSSISFKSKVKPSNINMAFLLLVHFVNLIVQGDYIETSLDDIMTLGWEIRQSDNEIDITLSVPFI